MDFILSSYIDKVIMHKNKRIAIVMIAGVVLVTSIHFFAGCSDKSTWPSNRVEADSGTRLVMGTFAHVVAVAFLAT